MIHDPLPLFPYQEVGAAFLASHPRAGLFDEPGVGKSAQAVRALDDTNSSRVIIVCPAAVRDVWQSEIRKFSRRRLRVIKGRGISDLGVWLKGRADVLILSYEMAARWASKIEGDLFDAIIFDEAHYLKTPAAARTKAMLGTHCDGAKGLARWASHAWFLTGTPMANDPLDIFSWMRFAGATDLGLGPFTTRYFKSSMGAFSARQTPRDEMVAELKYRIGQFSLRRTKEQAGLQIPPIFMTTTTIDGDTSEIRELLMEWPGLESAVIEAVEQGGLTFLDAQHIATLRRLVGEAKAPVYVELLAEEFHGGKGQTVIMGLHVKALAMVHEGLARRGIKGLLLLDPSKSGEYVELFQTDPSYQYFAVNIVRGGTGLTLTASADIDMLESSWSPAGNAQALMRVHRVGQKQQVRARFISLANSIDVVVTETVARKTAAIAKIQPPGETG